MTKIDEEIITVTYGKEDKWNSRKRAEKFFIECMMGSEGAERDRYTNVYMKLLNGNNYCTDDYE